MTKSQFPNNNQISISKQYDGSRFKVQGSRFRVPGSTVTQLPTPEP
jgi:hypothetical protein